MDYSKRERRESNKSLKKLKGRKRKSPFLEKVLFPARFEGHPN